MRTVFFTFQWLATLANSMMFLGVGMMAAVPTVVIGALHNSNQPLSLDDDQASWFGKYEYEYEYRVSLLISYIYANAFRLRL